MQIHLLTAALLAFTAAAHAAPILTPSTVVHGGIVNGSNFVTGTTGTLAATNNWPAAEDPARISDGVIGGSSKYLNFGQTNTAVILKNPAARPASRMELWVANDAPERDPASYQLYGTNAAIPALAAGNTFALSNFTLISSGELTLPADRDGTPDAAGFSHIVAFPNTTAYANYLVVFPTVKTPGSANSMQVSEVQLYDTGIIGVEQFDYPDGAVAGQSGGTFWNYKNFSPTGNGGAASTWDNVTPAPAISAGRLVTSGSSARREYNGALESDGAVNDPASSPSSVAKSVYYRVTVTTGATVPSFFGLSSFDFGSEKIFFGKRFGVDFFGVEEVGFGGTNSTVTIQPNRTYTLVTRLNYATDTISLFIDPDLNAPEPTVADASRAYTGSNWSTAVRLASGSGSPVTWDDLVVATSWDDLGTIVTTTADEDNLSLTPTAGGGAGISLREAVKYSPAGTLVTFADALSGQTCTLTHADGDMEIPSALTIDATALPGGFTLSGNNTSRHFDVFPGKSLTLRGLTLTRGNGVSGGQTVGGSIHNNGTLTLHRCALTGNASSSEGGAIYSTGALLATDTTFSDNTATESGGGLLLFSGPAELTRCTLSGNAAGRGGAISQGAATILSHCTVTGNLSTGIDAPGTIFCYAGNITLQHCTISQNTGNGAGGGLFLQAPATVNIQFSIIAGNADTSGRPDIFLFPNGPTLTATGTSIIGNNTSVETQFPAGALIGTAAAPLNPKLSPLGYFGGPVQTMHPLIGSPAIDAAGTTNPGGTDARGFPRFVDGDDSTVAQLDIGAVEAGPLYQFSSATDGALRSLLTLAGQPSQPQGIRIRFNIPGGSTITLGGTELTPPAGKAIFLDASNLTAPVTISGNNQSRVFSIPATATVAMHSLRIAGGNTSSGGFVEGGGILNAGHCTIMATSLSGNFASSFGGGIWNSGRCAVIASTLSGNGASAYGGGLHNTGTCTVHSSTFSGNAAYTEGFGGGGISNSSTGTCSVLFSTLSGNTTNAAEGGGIFNDGTFQLNSSIVAGNLPASGDNIFGSVTGSSNLTSGDPLLLPLGNYGGPTQTMPPLRGSPAIDAAAATSAQTDQRGFSRTRDGDGNGTAAPDIGAVEASLIFVSTTGDTGAGSLRAALTEAAAQPGPDTVHFTATVTPHITLASEIVITDTGGITLDASDRPTGLVIDAGTGTNRHFRIDTGTTAVFQRLRLYGGGGVGSGSPLNYGGSIYNSGALTLRECTFADNSSTSSAGAVYNQSGALTIERSTFHGNTSGGSGAILHESLTPMLITASTFTGNVGRFEGGAITLGGFRPATLTHCTIVGNAVTQTGGGGSGGIRAGNPGNASSNLLTLRDSIIAENTDANSPGVPNVNPGFVSQGSNLTTGNAHLAALGDYGGPAWTMPPMPGSLAIDNATASTATTDQRGVFRPLNGDNAGLAASDLGAVEVPVPLTVTTRFDDLDTPAGPTLSLREAIRDAEPGATILFNTTFNGEPGDTITLSQSLGQIAFTKGLIINASANPGGVTIDGGPGTNRIFQMPAGTGAYLNHLTLTGGNGGGGGLSGDSGGAIDGTSATLALTDCVLTGNSSPAYGGAISSYESQLTMNRCLLTGNSASNFGGAISSHAAGLTGPATGSTTLTNCTLTNNTSTVRGGAMDHDNGRATLRHCTITGNTAPAGLGAGVFSIGGTATRTTVQNCLIAANANASDVTSGTTTNSFLSLGGNLIGSGNATSAFNQPRDFTGQTAATLRLALLSDFGGPTRTIALRPGSSALGNAVANVNLIPITTDQRGFPAVGLKDSGAYEAGNDLLASYNSWIWETLPQTASEGEAVPNADFDRDGQTNEAEWLAQTNPGNPASVFGTTSFISGQFFVVEFPTVTGRSYTLQFSDDLQPGGWFDIAGLTGAGNVQSFSVPRQQPRRFFRVRISR